MGPGGSNYAPSDAGEMSDTPYNIGDRSFDNHSIYVGDRAAGDLSCLFYFNGGRI